MNYFDLNCRQCPRLATFLDEVKEKYPDYHARPVPPFGVDDPKLLVVGLAPGMHGANATGRPFTGDHAGILLYKALYKFGFSNQETATSADDGLELINCRISNAVKCLPPANKPTGAEINICNQFLSSELETLSPGTVIVALGTVAHKAVIKARNLKQKDYPFGHGNTASLANGQWLLDSYHCSRYNTQTRRLTEKMFFEIFKKSLEIININN
ncbi:MAG: uracil-DNA glycosylase family 4 [Gammaproteobacteria bacterium]|jgi:uracil-DNA glycosylase family 4